VHASVPDGSCLTSSGVDDSIRAAAWIGRSVSARRCGRRGTGGARVHDRRRRDRLRWQEYFFPPRGGFNVRCTRERYIPKNVFFLREEVLIYDAPSLPRKDNRFDQELLREEVLIYDAPDSATFPRMFSSSARRF